MRPSRPPPPGSCPRCTIQNPPSAGRTPTASYSPSTRHRHREGADDDAGTPLARTTPGCPDVRHAGTQERPQPVELAAADPHPLAAAGPHLQPLGPQAQWMAVLLLVPDQFHSARGRGNRHRLREDEGEEMT